MRGNTVHMNLLAWRSVKAEESLYQYDYGQRLIFSGVELPSVYEVHFSNMPHGESKTMLGDSTGVDIPNEYLLSGESVFVWIFFHVGESDGETEFAGWIPVKLRANPTDKEPTPAQQDIIGQAVEALNNAVDNVAEDIDNALQEAKDSGEFDGFSPIATVEKEGKVTTISITDKNGTTTAQVEDGDTIETATEEETQAVIDAWEV